MMIILIFLPQIMQVNSETIPSLKKGMYVRWSVELKVLDRSKGQTEHYWSAENYMKILDMNQTGELMTIIYAYYTRFYDVVVGKYSSQEKTPRIMEGMHINNGSAIATFSGGETYEYLFHKETWMFKIDFPFTPYAIFNTKKEDFLDWFNETYLIRTVAGKRRQCGILFETWDIVLGSRRYIYYAEIYYLVSEINLGEPEIPETSILEINVGIDKSVGIITRLRYFWQYSTNLMFELILSIQDTNIFRKATFTIGLFVAFISLIVLYAAYRIYRKRRRLKKIRI